MKNKVAKQIYDYLAKRLQLPVFSFQLGLTTNSSMIFTSLNETPAEYFCDAQPFTYQVRIYNPKMEHSKQWELVERVLNELSLETFKKMEYNINGITYKTNAIYINDFPNPSIQYVNATLESYTDATQCYTFKLSVILERNNV